MDPECSKYSKTTSLVNLSNILPYGVSNCVRG